MTPLALTAGDVSLLVGAAVTLLTLVGSGIVWLIRQGRAQGEMLAKVEMLSAGTHEQVRNSHTVNLRDDVDKAVATAERAAAGTERNEALLLGIVASLERLERTVTEDREDRVRADREMRAELDRIWVSGEREHRSIWQRLGDGLGVARPGEIDGPDEPY